MYFDLATDDYNCTWSPDGQLVAYATGTLSAAQLVMVRGDDTSLSPVPLAQDPGANNFDGNPDWAPDARPVCPDRTVITTVNTPVTFDVECTDTGPAYEQTAVRDFDITQPTEGTLTQEFADDPYTYKPNAGFTGTDSFVIGSFDELGFGSDTGKVTINVRPAAGGGGGAQPKCGGRTATIVGTEGSETLLGTSGRDVIVGLGGNDRVRAGRGNDIVWAALVATASAAAGATTASAAAGTTTASTASAALGRR